MSQKCSINNDTCKPMAVLFQCMTKFTTNKKKKIKPQWKRKKKKCCFSSRIESGLAVGEVGSRETLGELQDSRWIVRTCGLRQYCEIEEKNISEMRQGDGLQRTWSQWQIGENKGWRSRGCCPGLWLEWTLYPLSRGPRPLATARENPHTAAESPSTTAETQHRQ